MRHVDNLIKSIGTRDALPRVYKGVYANYKMSRGAIYNAQGRKLVGANTYKMFGCFDYNGKYGLNGYNVHHINGDHSDNRRANCITVSVELHQYIHRVAEQMFNESRYSYHIAQNMRTINTAATIKALEQWAAR